MTTWFYTMIEEQYEYEQSEERDSIFQMIVEADMPCLKEYCETALTGLEVPKCIHDAILNSVDWIHLMDLLDKFMGEVIDKNILRG